jgi:hypothetical protein
VAAVVPAEDIANWRPVLGGLCATLVGIGLARFGQCEVLMKVKKELTSIVNRTLYGRHQS